MISNEQSNREKLLEDLKQAEFETKEKEQKIKIIKERILERYDASVPNDLVVDQSKEQLEIEISKMQRSIENIGPINMAVQDEHSEAMERLEILSSQKNDLLQKMIYCGVQAASKKWSMPLPDWAQTISQLDIMLPDRLRLNMNKKWIMLIF